MAPTGSGVLGKRSREAWILDKAKQQRMNTDLRKTLFGVIVTSEVGGGTDTLKGVQTKLQQEGGKNGTRTPNTVVTGYYY